MKNLLTLVLLVGVANTFTADGDRQLSRSSSTNSLASQNSDDLFHDLTTDPDAAQARFQETQEGWASYLTDRVYSTARTASTLVTPAPRVTARFTPPSNSDDGVDQEGNFIFDIQFPHLLPGYISNIWSPNTGFAFTRRMKQLTNPAQTLANSVYATTASVAASLSSFTTSATTPTLLPDQSQQPSE